jgi:hypothetical protein
MRFYTITISDPVSDKVIRKYSSLDEKGNVMLGALNVELDVPIYQFAYPCGDNTIRIWGISLQEIKDSSSYNGKTMRIYAGMSKGLPLANPKQANLIVEGVINQCFGNWQDTNMTLDFVVVYGIGGTELKPNNISLNWTKGMTLGNAVKNALAIAAPKVKCTDITSEDLVLNQDEPGFYENMVQFSQYVQTVSRHIKGGTYPGVNISFRNNQFYVADGTTETTPKKILFTDLVGQPSWIAPNEVVFKTIMRADLNVSDYITLPQTQITTAAQSQSQFRNSSILKGSFQIDRVRHVGNFRQPDGNSWVTIFNVHPASANN